MREVRIRLGILAVVLALAVPAGTTRAAAGGTCPRGASNCLDATIAQMQQQFEAEAATCDHTAVFTLAYLRVTQTYRWAGGLPGFFADTAWVDREDSLFAGYYFQAFGDDQAGRAGVPAAWSIAFDAARHHSVTALGDALLGMNAHINRDLPYVLAAIGLTGPGGASHKPDHDKIQQLLAATIQPVLDEIAARFDPTATQYGGLGTAGALQLIATWRDLAWHNAELLAAAPTPEARSLVALTIEATSAVEAEALVATNDYLPLLQSSAPSDHWCAAHGADAPPTPYAFGPATA